MICVFCNKDTKIEKTVSRRDTCSHCDGDLHCCKQCKFYEQSAYNECKEVSAERIVDKERSNYCDYFQPRGSKNKCSGNTNRTRQARAALNDLFKKA